MKISYGKLEVPVHVVSAHGVLACEVSLEVLGDVFAPSYTEGDNSRVVATDTMKNVILRHALEQDSSSLHALIDGLGTYFLATYEDMEAVKLTAVETPFEQVTEKLFRAIDADHEIARVERDREGVRERSSSLVGLRLLKTTGSAFTKFARDDETTLPERLDRPLFVFIDVHWRGEATAAEVRRIVLQTFDEFVSESIQQLVHEMGQRMLAAIPSLQWVRFDAQNHTQDPVPGSPDPPQLPRAYTSPFPAWGLITLELER